MPEQPYAEHSDSDWNGWAKIRDISIVEDTAENRVITSATYTFEVNNTHPDGKKGLWRPEFSHKLEVFTDNTEAQRLNEWIGTLPRNQVIDVECRAGETITEDDIQIYNVIRIGENIPNDGKYWKLTVYIDVLAIDNDFDGRTKTGEFTYDLTLDDD